MQDGGPYEPPFEPSRAGENESAGRRRRRRDTSERSIGKAERTAPHTRSEVPLAAALASATPWRRRLSLALQQLYFLRFPVLGWVALPLLCSVDRTRVNAVTRGIMTMTRSWQVFFAVFFIVALAHTVLICTKNIMRNGRFRFAGGDRSTKDLDRVPPGWLAAKLHDNRTGPMLRVLFVTHIPTILTIVYLAWTARQEHETGFWLPLLHNSYWHFIVAALLALLVAFLFWYGVTIFYLWVYPHFSEDSVNYREPWALLFPGSLPGMQAAQSSCKPRVARWAELALSPLVWLSHRGYAARQGDPAWEFHTLSLVALSWFFTLYLFLYPLTAPVVLSGKPKIATGVSLIFAAILLWGSRNASGTAAQDSGRHIVWVLRVVIGIALALFLTLLWWGARTNSVIMENWFPVLASLLVILIFTIWTLSGAAFFLDRFRVPVLTALLVLWALSKLVLQGVDQEHYFEARDTRRVDHLPTPLEVVASRMQQSPDRPLVIVTATGGGIQAAEWTAQVMAQLEKRFREDPTLHGADFSLHDHLLLASGVSGGSVGLMPYLLEYTTAIDPATQRPRPIFQTVPAPAGVDSDPTDLLTRRLTRAPACSSLEAVAWGLEYNDLARLLFTFHVLPPIENQKLRKGDAAEPDRTWALSQSFDRNFADRDCGTDPYAQPKEASFRNLAPIENGGVETLGSAARRLANGTMPAFSFNTTVAETGGRFLLSNYGIQTPPHEACGGRCPVTLPGREFLPAESFLQAYASESNCDRSAPKADCYADISLATAARLSATFPVVSSATRIPRKYAARASHFVDGGYFDNDGTGSATEFLLSALQMNRDCAQDHVISPYLNEICPRQGGAANSSAPFLLMPAKKKLKILLVEIRDGDDMNPTENIDDLDHQTGKSLPRSAPQPRPWGSLSQLAGPVESMWEAGHESITRRNRRELCLLRQAYADDLVIYHVVLGIPPAPSGGRPGKTKTAPLSWKLTTAQADYIRDWAQADGKPTQQTISHALTWVEDNLNPMAPQAQSPCMVEDQTYMR